MQFKRLLRVLLTALLCCGGVVGAGGKTEKKYRKLQRIERKCDAKIRPLRELLNLPLSSVAAVARLLAEKAAMAAEIEQLKADKTALTNMMETVQAGCQAATVDTATAEPTTIGAEEDCNSLVGCSWSCPPSESPCHSEDACQCECQCEDAFAP